MGNDIVMEDVCHAVTSVIEERKRQHKLWGEQNHAPAFWLSILGEEFGEVCKAVYEKNDAAYLEELVHVAAVAVQMIECERRRINGIIKD